MAGKDFAQVKETHRDRKERKKNTGSIPLRTIIFALTCIIVSFAAGFMMGEKQHAETTPQTNTSRDNSVQQQRIQQLKAQTEVIKKLQQDVAQCAQQQKEASQLGDLTFYSQLPKQAVTPEPLHVSATHKKPMPAAADIAANTNKNDAHDTSIKEEKKSTKQEGSPQQAATSKGPSFHIQIASFKQRADAKALINKLQTIGIHAVVQRVNLNKFGTRYRVNTTRFKQKKSALKVKKNIENKFNITGIMIQHG